MVPRSVNRCRDRLGPPTAYSDTFQSVCRVCARFTIKKTKSISLGMETRNHHVAHTYAYFFLFIRKLLTIGPRTWHKNSSFVLLFYLVAEGTCHALGHYWENQCTEDFRWTAFRRANRRQLDTRTPVDGWCSGTLYASIAWRPATPIERDDNTTRNPCGSELWEIGACSRIISTGARIQRVNTSGLWSTSWLERNVMRTFMQKLNHDTQRNRTSEILFYTSSFSTDFLLFELNVLIFTVETPKRWK